MDIKSLAPWWAKIALKLLLSRIGVNYRVWQRLSLFKHGYMEDPSYALDVFRMHFERSGLGADFVIAEIGPGDSLFTAVIAKAYGAKSCYLIDVGPFARSDIGPYLTLIRELRKLGRLSDELKGKLQKCTTVQDILIACDAVYLTEGTRSLHSIPDATIDLIFSQAALEHVRRGDFEELVREMRRITRAGGIGSHDIDLKDHLGGKLNNLRFPERIWESNFMAKSGFYTNRIRYEEMLEKFRRGGFQYEVVATRKFIKVPTPKSVMAEPFKQLADDNLIVSSFDVILR